MNLNTVMQSSFRTVIVDLHKFRRERPECDIYIGRAVEGTEFTEDSIWANHFTLEQYGEKCLDLYEIDIRAKIRENPQKYNLESLRGKRLGCWCITTSVIYPMRCHGQVLMKLLKELSPK